MNIHFADVCWDTEDVRSALVNAGIEPTGENVSKALDECLVNEEGLIDSMIETGWAFINEIVESVFKE